MAADPNFPHFSHEHPLIFEDEAELDIGDDVRMKDCGICGLLMFINPSYTCKTDNCAGFSIHKQCKELPEGKKIKFNSTSYDLIVLPKESIKKKKPRCSKCGQIIHNNFMYNTRGRYEKSYFHLFCVSPTEIKTKHRSHHENSMTPTHKKISAFCNACGENKEDHFLSCQACNYWIHKHCASLPSVGMHASHPYHPLILLYSNPFSKQNPFWGGEDGKCGICEQHIPIENAAYMCQACSYFVHLKCVESDIRRLTPQESKTQIIELPPGENDYEVLPGILISNEVQRFKGDEISDTIVNMTPEECHNHNSLILHGKDDHHEISGLLCDACIKPISTSYYSCSAEKGCHFLVHESCANLPKAIPRKFDHPRMHLFRESTSEFFRTFDCDICNRRCNGFGYSNDEKPQWWSDVIADVECASAPRTIKHQSHHHFLHLMKWESFSIDPQVNCCGQSMSKQFLYMCISCDFNIHISCALLSKKVSHEFDDHPLVLITNPKKSSDDKDKNHDDHLFCEFCEEDINDEFWFYKCNKCDQSFHVNCIPSVGELSKFKFGGTLDGVHCHPHHPLTSVSMLTITNQTCGYCLQIIKGFTNDADVAFQCSQCDFWIHWHCARPDIMRELWKKISALIKI